LCQLICGYDVIEDPDKLIAIASTQAGWPMKPRRRRKPLMAAKYIGDADCSETEVASKGVSDNRMSPFPDEGGIFLGF
jgi:hypothetical protein